MRQKITYFEISKIIGNGENLHSNCVFDIIVNNQILHTTFVHVIHLYKIPINHLLSFNTSLQKKREIRRKKQKKKDFFFKRWGNKLKQILIDLLLN